MVVTDRRPTVRSLVVRKDCATVLLCSRYRVNKSGFRSRSRARASPCDFVRLSPSRWTACQSSHNAFSPHHTTSSNARLGLRASGYCRASGWALERRSDRSRPCRPKQKWLCGLHQVRSSWIWEPRFVSRRHYSSDAPLFSDRMSHRCSVWAYQDVVLQARLKMCTTHTQSVTQSSYLRNVRPLRDMFATAHLTILTLGLLQLMFAHTNQA